MKAITFPIHILFLTVFSVLGTVAFAQNSDEPASENETSPAVERKTDEPEGSDAATKQDEGKAIVDDADRKIPDVSYDLEALPFSTRRMHELLLEATKSGDIEKLRPYIGSGEFATQLSLGGPDGDPIEFLKQSSGDDEGHEILAILEEILQSGYVRMDPDTEHEVYVWPYFFAMPIEALTAKQKVELFRIVTYGDFLDMKDFGGYIFYRVGISPEGRWEFFVAGD